MNPISKVKEKLFWWPKWDFILEYTYDTPIRCWQLCLCMLEWGWVRRAGRAVTPRSPLSASLRRYSAPQYSVGHIVTLTQCHGDNVSNQISTDLSCSFHTVSTLIPKYCLVKSGCLLISRKPISQPTDCPDYILSPKRWELLRFSFYPQTQFWYHNILDVLVLDIVLVVVGNGRWAGLAVEFECAMQINPF